MLTEICAWLRNHFEREVYREKVVISGGKLTGFDDRLLDGQYFRITGSVLNDGVHLYPDAELRDETFEGAVWSLAIPEAVVTISEEIKAWRAKYEDINSPSMSPYLSESFGGYSYSKGTISGQNNSDGSWQIVFGKRLAPWRKL